MMTNNRMQNLKALIQNVGEEAVNAKYKTTLFIQEQKVGSNKIS